LETSAGSIDKARSAEFVSSAKPDRQGTIGGVCVIRKARSLSLLDTALTRLSARIAPLIRDEIVGALIAELERHFNEQLLTELQEKVEAIVVRELPKRVEEIIDRVLIAKQSQIFDGEVYRRRYRPNEIVAGSIAGEYMTASNPLASDFLHPAYQEFCRISKTPLQLHRKLWEWAFIYDRLSKAGVLRQGCRGVGFGVGAEKLPSLFASLGARITATDAPVGQNWGRTTDVSDHKSWLFDPGIIDRQSFDDRVSFEYCDMNDIPSHLTDYDFCWSSCSFEHLGSLQHGIDFVVNSVERSLKVGGVACHTTEFNLSSDDQTIETGVSVVYRKRDLEGLSRMLQERGHWVEPLRIEPGTLPPDYFVDVPPYLNNPHLKLLYESYVLTSVGLVARRGR
jgi:hypothetical protein